MKYHAQICAESREAAFLVPEFLNIFPIRDTSAGNTAQPFLRRAKKRRRCGVSSQGPRDSMCIELQRTAQQAMELIVRVTEQSAPRRTKSFHVGREQSASAAGLYDGRLGKYMENSK